MPAATCKLMLVTGQTFRRPFVESTVERQALADRAREVKVERVLVELGAATLPEEEARVLRVMLRSAVSGQPLKKAWQIAADADVTLKQLERVCDRLLARGLIGPRVRRAQ